MIIILLIQILTSVTILDGPDTWSRAQAFFSGLNYPKSEVKADFDVFRIYFGDEIVKHIEI